MTSTEKMAKVIRAARGQEPLDLKIVGGKVLSVFDGTVFEGCVGVKEGTIATLDASGLEAAETFDAGGAFLCPSFIDAHIHVESSMLTPERFAEAVVPRGTGAAVSDPHEIANVLGTAGVLYMVSASEGLPVDLIFTAPSCVPATHLETAGAELGAGDVEKLFGLLPGCPALSEMMNFPGVLLSLPGTLGKIAAARARGLVVDGHSPFLSGRDLDAYLSAGIETDHECTTAAEVREKLRKGCFILAREGSASRNLEECLKAWTPGNSSRFAIVSDDRHPETLMEEGHLDDALRKAVSFGIDPVEAVKMVTINPARIMGLKRRGAVAPGYSADIAVVKDLEKFSVKATFFRGIKVAEEGRLIGTVSPRPDQRVLSTVNVPGDLEEKLCFPQSGKVKVIRVFGDQILTSAETADAGDAAAGKINYAAVIERHGRNGNVGIGFVAGLGLQRGALASTVSHDSHNVVAVGRTPGDMLRAVEALRKCGGGISAADADGAAALPLRVAGLMSTEPLREVVRSLKILHEKAASLGTPLPSPFMTMAFIALPVIPELRLTDMGLVDVGRFELVGLRAD